MYFLTSQSEDMLNLCLNFNESQPVYAFKRYAYYEKESMMVMFCSVKESLCCKSSA